MSSASSTERGRRAPSAATTPEDTSFRPWHFYLLLSMAGATWAVIVSKNTEPAALLLLSAAVIAAGLVASALHYTIVGFMAADSSGSAPVSARTREYLEREKALTLRSIKELEFDHAMKKIGEKDFAELSTRLRGRAMELMQALDQPDTELAKTQRPAPRVQAKAATGECLSCSTINDSDARFCKQCGAKL